MTDEQLLAVAESMHPAPAKQGKYHLVLGGRKLCRHGRDDYATEYAAMCALRDACKRRIEKAHRSRWVRGRQMSPEDRGLVDVHGSHLADLLIERGIAAVVVDP